MSITADLRTYLLTQTPITNLVSTRVYLDDVPQGSGPAANLPAITIRQISSTHSHTLTAAAGFAEATLQVNAVAVTRVACRAIVDAIRGETSGFSGTWGSTTVHGCQFGPVVDDDGAPAHGEGAAPRETACDLAVQFAETVPTF